MLLEYIMYLRGVWMPFGIGNGNGGYGNGRSGNLRGRMSLIHPIGGIGVLIPNN